VCPEKGLRRVGTHYPVPSLAEVLLRDSAYYQTSGGGVTLSGGECTMFPGYVEGLLRLLKTEGLHVVLETCGYFHYPTFAERILPYVDLIYYDIKLMDRKAHRTYVGKSNERILRNFLTLVRDGRCAVQPRVPLVPGITATEENLSAIVRFLKEAGADQVALLPYNPMGLDKYRSLGRPAPELPTGFMKPHDEQAIYDLLARSMRKRRLDRQPMRNDGRWQEGGRPNRSHDQPE
jgi:pyruvate formate lyase activating enzyme